MNPTITLLLVLMGTNALISLLLTGVVTIAWKVGLKHLRLTGTDLLLIRLLPAGGGLLIALTVVLPAFLSYEPRHEYETAGPLLLLLSGFSLVCFIHGMWRGWRACAAARALLKSCGPLSRSIVQNGQEVRVLSIAEPLAASIGPWRPQIVATESVRSACSQDEFQQVVAHEIAHLRARDNLKLLLLVSAPDAMAWMPLGGDLEDRWHAATEREADQRAAGDDPHRRLALASALVKLARLSAAGQRADTRFGRHTLGMQAAIDDVAARVHELLAPPCPAGTSRGLLAVGLIAILVPAVAVPLHAGIQELIEQLVRVGL